MPGTPSVGCVGAGWMSVEVDLPIMYYKLIKWRDQKQESDDVLG